MQHAAKTNAQTQLSSAAKMYITLSAGPYCHPLQAGHLNMPVWSAYCSSKHALESFSDCLRYELQQFGVPVVLIKPGPVATPIWQKARDKSTVEVDQERFAAAMEVYGDMIVGVSGAVDCYVT
jgi:NAD(P)-dependent dehydrogenase (short-subunit alcohol dehydrogenase family)